MYYWFQRQIKPHLNIIHMRILRGGRQQRHKGASGTEKMKCGQETLCGEKEGERGWEEGGEGQTGEGSGKISRWRRGRTRQEEKDPEKRRYRKRDDKAHGGRGEAQNVPADAGGQWRAGLSLSSTGYLTPFANLLVKEQQKVRHRSTPQKFRGSAPRMWPQELIRGASLG